MFLVRELEREVPLPCMVVETRTFVIVYCPEHGDVAVFSAAGADRQAIIAEAEKHARAYHCGDA